MSIVPLMFRDWWEEFDRPASRLIDQHFGSGLSRDDLLTSFSSLGLGRSRPLFSTPGYYRPWRTLARQNSGGASTIQCDKDKFEVSCEFLVSQHWPFSHCAGDFNVISFNSEYLLKILISIMSSGSDHRLP